MKKYKLIEIFKKEIIENNTDVTVYDLTIDNNETYTANNYIVHNCTTSANGSIHYPIASLINECYEISKNFETPSKIIADGGFKNYSDIIKALALGADYVMLGGIFNKCLESCGETYRKDENGEYVQLFSNYNWYYSVEPLYKKFRGMSTKEVQKFWGKINLKTSEGIVKYNVVEYTLSGWVENFTDYLKSAMSYTGSNNLENFRGQVEFINISMNSYNRFNK